MSFMAQEVERNKERVIHHLKEVVTAIDKFVKSKVKYNRQLVINHNTIRSVMKNTEDLFKVLYFDVVFNSLFEVMSEPVLMAVSDRSAPGAIIGDGFVVDSFVRHGVACDLNIQMFGKLANL